MNELQDRVAVITGASSGMGEETALALSKMGAKVALLARRKDKLDKIVSTIVDNGGQALAIEVDVTDQASVDTAAKQVQDKIGTTSLVFNNAGIMLPAPIEELRLDDWEHMIDLNIKGVMRIIYAFVPQLVESAKNGVTADLINMSSIAAQNIFPNFAVYSGSKAFVSHLSRHLRTELGPKDVRVAMIEPGIVETELQSHVTDKGANDWLEGSKSDMDWLQGSDVANIIAFLACRPKHVNLQQVTIMPTRQTM